MFVSRDQNQWVSYDNENTLKKKMEYANKKCLGGVMVSFQENSVPRKVADVAPGLGRFDG
jgi:GH18 family chitinase